MTVRLGALIIPFLLINLILLADLSFLSGYGAWAGEAKRGGTLRVALTSEIRSLDPARVGDTASSLIASQIYEGLLELDDKLQLRPGLAESLESPDGITWTFRLRKGVRFQDDPCFPGGAGRGLTAHDVKYSFLRIADPDVLSTGWWIFRGRVKGMDAYRRELLAAKEEGRKPRVMDVAGLKVLDDRTLRIELTKPFAPFLNLLAMSYAWVVPREVVECRGVDFFRHPVGTGPFVLEEWRPGVHVLLKRNQNYWGKDERGEKLPRLDGIRIRMLRDNLVAFLEFDRGNLDYTGIPEEVWTRVMTPERKLKKKYRKYLLFTVPSLDVHYYGFMMDKEPFAGNRLLRQALNYAVNREAIIKHVLNGRGVPASGVLPPGIPGHRGDLSGYRYDLDKAKELLALAGYPRGEGLPELTLQLNSGGTLNEDIAAAVQAMLAEVGVKVKLMVVSWPQHLDSIDRGKPHFFRLGWIADYPDPENFLALLYGKNHSPAGPNSTRYANTRFDELYQRALSLTNSEKRMKLYMEAEKIAVEDAPWLFLTHSEVYRLTQPYLRNMEANPMDIVRFKDVWLAK